TQQIARIGHDGLALGRVAELALDEVGEVTQQHRAARGAVQLRLVQRALDGVAEARQLVPHAASFGGGGHVTPLSRFHSNTQWPPPSTMMTRSARAIPSMMRPARMESFALRSARSRLTKRSTGKFWPP